VVRLEFPEQPGAKRYWWFLNQDDQVELCLNDPGFGVDLYIAVSLRDMILIWRGDLPLAQAVDRGRLDAHGTTAIRRALTRWLGIGTLAHGKSQRGLRAELARRRSCRAAGG
jgi:hypothetical protein